MTSCAPPLPAPPAPWAELDTASSLKSRSTRHHLSTSPCGCHTHLRCPQPPSCCTSSPAAQNSADVGCFTLMKYSRCRNDSVWTVHNNCLFSLYISTQNGCNSVNQQMFSAMLCAAAAAAGKGTQSLANRSYMPTQRSYLDTCVQERSSGHRKDIAGSPQQTQLETSFRQHAEPSNLAVLKCSQAFASCFGVGILSPLSIALFGLLAAFWVSSIHRILSFLANEPVDVCKVGICTILYSWIHPCVACSTPCFRT